MNAAMPLSMREFRDYVRQVLADLPVELRPHLANVVVDVEEHADEETLRLAGFSDEEIAAGADLFGLFVPFPLDTEALDLEALPRRLLIFKAPHEEEFPDRQRMLIEIKKTVVHELAHHFGWTDEDLARFDAKPDPFSKDPDWVR